MVRAWQAVIDPVLFSSFWAASVAAGLAAAAAAVLGASPVAWVGALSFAGTLCVYNVDRVRDLERDARLAPDRTAFVRRHQRGLSVVAGAAGLAALVCAVMLGREVVGLCAAVLAVGLLHRRLKHWPAFKTAYVTLSWLAITVGVPIARVAGEGGAVGAHAVSALAVLGASLAANLIATNAHPARRPQTGERHAALALALSLATGATLASWLTPVAVRPLGWIAASEAIAIAGGWLAVTEATDERYDMLVLDGALLGGALLALACS